jgi:hypothetical protein
MVSVYVPQENCNLKLVAEVEDTDDATEAVLAVVEDTRKPADEYVAIVGDLEEGDVTTVRQVQTTTWGAAANGRAAVAEKPTKKRGPGRPRKEVVEEEEAPAPKRGRGRPKGSTNKKAASSGGQRGRKATLTEEILEQALEMHNDQGMSMTDIASELGVSSSGYLAKKIRETFGNDALGEVKRGRPRKTEDAPAPKRGRGRPKGSTNKTTTKTRGKASVGRPKASAKKKSPFAAKGEDD